MLDLHCHLLPGIDDGPKSLKDALAMCRRAVAEGIRKAVVTPHIIPGRYDNNKKSITQAWKILKRELASAGIALELGMAAEVRLDPVLMEMIEAGQVPFLGEYQGEQVLLLEFPHTHIPPGSLEFIAWLLKRKIRPMIAHPERNGDVITRFKKIEPFVEAGCLLQITGASLEGVFGPEARKRGIQMLKMDWVTIIASDAHNLHGRPPRLETGRLAAAKVVGEIKSWEMVRDRPEQIAAAHFKTDA